MYIIIHIYIYYVNVKCKYRQAAKICQAPSHPLVPSTSIPLVAHEVRCSRPGRFDVFVQVPMAMNSWEFKRSLMWFYSDLVGL